VQPEGEAWQGQPICDRTAIRADRRGAGPIGAAVAAMHDLYWPILGDDHPPRERDPASRAGITAHTRRYFRTKRAACERRIDVVGARPQPLPPLFSTAPVLALPPAP